jgi:hypothetical protein
LYKLKGVCHSYNSARELGYPYLSSSRWLGKGRKFACLYTPIGGIQEDEADKMDEMVTPFDVEDELKKLKKTSQSYDAGG